MQGPVTFDRLLKAADEPGNWLMYSHNYNSWRYSSLDQINAQTVKNLHVKWIFQGRHVEKFETTPLVANGDHVSHASRERHLRAGCRHRPPVVELRIPQSGAHLSTAAAK